MTYKLSVITCTHRSKRDEIDIDSMRIQRMPKAFKPSLSLQTMHFEYLKKDNRNMHEEMP